MQSQNIENAVEIVMSWKGSVLETDLVDVRQPRSVFIGSEGAVRFLVPSEALPSGRALLLSAEDGLVKLKPADIKGRERGPSSMPEGLGELTTRRELREPCP